MANSKSKFKKIVHVRVRPELYEWMIRQIPERYPSQSFMIDQLLLKDRRMQHRMKKGL